MVAMRPVVETIVVVVIIIVGRSLGAPVLLRTVRMLRVEVL